jgi:hypothetical protein
MNRHARDAEAIAQERVPAGREFKGEHYSSGNTGEGAPQDAGPRKDNRVDFGTRDRAWGKILKGELPLTLDRDYARMSAALSGMLCVRRRSSGRRQDLAKLERSKGPGPIDGVLELVDRARPLHLSLVGGDPLVRYREVEAVIPQLLHRGIHVRVVTSAFRLLAANWAVLRGLNVVVSMDGLQPEHDVRRALATYGRILKNIAGQNVTIHCTVTGQMMRQPGYLKQFVEFWTSREEIRKVWFSLFTPQSHCGFDRLAQKFCEAGMPEALIRHLGRSENQDRPLPVRRQSGLFLVRDA